MTGTELAERAGFRQAHVSNFLNGRRGLSIEAMDRVMASLRLEVRNLMPEGQRATVAASAGGRAAFEPIPILGLDSPLLHREFGENECGEFLCVLRSVLRRTRAAMESSRAGWRRFVMIRVDKETGEAMRPRLRAGSLLLVDRHYNALRDYRRGEPSIFVVRGQQRCQIRYVEMLGNHLMLRPENTVVPLGFLALGKNEKASDYLVGRVAMVCSEV